MTCDQNLCSNAGSATLECSDPAKCHLLCRESNGTGDAARGVLDVAVQAKQINIHNFIKKTARSGRILSLIVDEANIA